MKIAADIYAEWHLNRIHTDWAVLAAQEHRLADLRYRNDVLGFAKQMMRKAGVYFKRIVETLSKDGYRFACENNPMLEPEAGISELTADFRERGIYIPIILEAWMTEVGSVNLMGSHPDWTVPAYAFDDDTAMIDPIRTDPFVCEVTASYLKYLYDEWESLDPEKRSPFAIDFSPDDLHKANVSGGPPYQLKASQPTVDSIVLNERHCTSFVGIVRIALRWNGFPGFDFISHQENWPQTQYFI